VGYSKVINWDVFRELCRYRDGNNCLIKDWGIKSCSPTNRGAMKKCRFWKNMKDIQKERGANEKFNAAKEKKFREFTC